MTKKISLITGACSGLGMEAAPSQAASGHDDTRGPGVRARRPGRPPHRSLRPPQGGRRADGPGRGDQVVGALHLLGTGRLGVSGRVPPVVVSAGSTRTHVVVEVTTDGDGPAGFAAACRGGAR